jgi:hypothetical protein
LDRLEEFRGLERSDDLATPGHLGQARGEVHGVAEHIAVALDHRAVVHADAHPEADLVDRGHVVDAQLDIHGGLACAGNGGEDRHHFVPDRLHHPAAVLLGECGEELHAKLDGGVGRRIAHQLV